MYNVTQKYLNNIGKNGRTISWFGTITLEDGETVYHFDATNMSADNFSITMQVSSEQIEIGSTGSAELKLGLKLTEVSGVYYLDGQAVDRYALYNSVVDITFRLYYSDNTYEDVPMGIFTVAEPSRSKQTIILDAFDNMVKFNLPVGTLGDGTPYDLLNYICLQCGVTLGNTEQEIEALTNGTEVLTPGQVTTVSTWRDAIGQIASILCAVAVIGRDGKLYLKQYSTSLTRQIDKTFRYSYEVADYETFYTGIQTYDMSAEEIVGDGTGDNGLVYDLGTNGFIQGADIQDRVSAILNKLDDFSYTPFTASTIEDPSLECLDVIEFVGDQAVSGKYAAITTIKYGFGAMEITCAGKNPKIKESQSSISSTVGNMSQTKGNVRFLASTNTSAITVSDGNEEEIVNMNVMASVQTPVVLSVDVKHTAETTESYSNGVWTENDLVLTSKIVLNEVEQSYVPEESEFDGVRTFHFTYPMVLGAGSNEISILLSCDGGDASIEIGDVQMSVIGAGVDTLRIVSITVGHMPTKLFPNGTVSYDGLVIDGVYNNGSTTNVTNDCTITPAEGTPIAGDAEVVTMRATYGNFIVDFDAPVRPMFSFKRQTDGTMQDSTQVAGEIVKIGSEYFYIKKDETTTELTVRYANIVLDQTGRPIASTKKGAWVVTFSKSIKGIETFIVGTKMYAMYTNGGSASEIKWFDFSNETNGTATVTLHDDPNASGRTLTDITVNRDEYLEAPGIYNVDGYNLLASVNMLTSAGTAMGFAYLVVSGTTVDVYGVAWGTIRFRFAFFSDDTTEYPLYSDVYTIGNYRFLAKNRSSSFLDNSYRIYVTEIHFDTTNLLTKVDNVWISDFEFGFGFYDVYMIDGTDIFDLTTNHTYHMFLDPTDWTGYSTVNVGNQTRYFDGKMRYIEDQGVYIHMATDSSIEEEKRYLTPMMYYTTDFETWTGMANPLKENTPVEFSDTMSSNLLETGDGHIIGCCYNHVANEVAFACTIDVDLGA